MTKENQTYDEEYLCIGVGSRQRSGKHILFIDADNTTKCEAEQMAKEIISSVCCSDCYIIQSSKGNHHIVCLDLFSFNEVQKIAKRFAHGKWAKYRSEAKDFVLRTSPKMKLLPAKQPANPPTHQPNNPPTKQPTNQRVKGSQLTSNGLQSTVNGSIDIQLKEVKGTAPRLVSIVRSPYSYRRKSNSMRQLFSRLWGIEIKKDKMFTDNSFFRFHTYRVRLKREKQPSKLE